MPDNQIISGNERTAESLKNIVPPILIAFGAISLLRTSRFLSLVALGACLYDAAVDADANRKARGRDIAARRADHHRIDTAIEDSFPASDPPSSSGSTAGSPGPKAP